MKKMKCCEYNLCGLYYKHMTIINDESSIVNKLGASLTDDARVIIYDCHMFIVQAADHSYLAYSMQIFLLSNCNSHAVWKIMFMNETKRYKIWLRPKGWVQKIFRAPMPLISLRVLSLNFLPSNIGLGWKYLPRANTSAYFAVASNDEGKSVLWRWLQEKILKKKN
jgi:hypothetical protein